MPTITYIENVPDAPNNPSADQPDMKINTNATKTIINVDHYTFGSTGNNNNDGFHRYVRMKELLALDPPPVITTDYGAVYVKPATSQGAGTETNLFFTDEGTNREYQLTRCINSKFSLLGTNTAYTASHTGGWSFLPGGLMIMYGIKLSSATSGTVTFPFAFDAAPYTVIATALVSASATPVAVSINSAGIIAASFTYKIESPGSGAITGISFTAIGK